MEPTFDLPERGSVASTFREFVERHQPFVRRQAARRLEQLVREGTLPRRRRSVEGVVDETLILAWEHRSEQPASGTTEDWLGHLLLQILDESVRHARETTPEIQPAESDDDDNGALAGEPDPVIWEDLLPDRKSPEQLHTTTTEEEREAVLVSLADLPSLDREAFTLFAFEGYNVDEIAFIQKRDPAGVRRAIETARGRFGRA